MAVEITSREELEEWLEDKPREWAQVVAYRSALRVMPLALVDVEGVPSRNEGYSRISLMRGLVVAAAAIWVPSRGEDEYGGAGTRWNVRTSCERAHRWLIQRSSKKHQRNYVSEALKAAAFAVIVFNNRSNLERYSEAAAQSVSSAYEAIKSANVGSADYIWDEISFDCEKLKRIGVRTLAHEALWIDRPSWFDEFWGRSARLLSKKTGGFEVWREWFYGRLVGRQNSFAGFSENEDASFNRQLVRLDESFWARDPIQVNAEIKELVDSLRKPKVPSDEELKQNPRAFTFSLDGEGRTVIDEDILPNGLQGDADERDNHSELLRLIANASLATAGDTNAKDMAEPTDLLKEAVGETVEQLRPRLFVLRAREMIRQVKEREDGTSMNPQLSEKQRDAFIPLISALDMIAEFSPKLAELWHGKLGQTGEPLTREMLDLIAEAFRSSRQTTELAQAIIEASNAQVAPDAPEDDPARIAASETSRNAVRKMGGTLKNAGDGARALESIAKLTERVVKIANILKGRLPDGETISRILQMFLGG